MQHGGSFRTRRLATIRAAAIEGELAALRIPDLRIAVEPANSPTFEQAARAWQASRLDIADSTREQHRIQLDKLLPLIRTRRVDELAPGDFADVVATLHRDGVAWETIRKTLGAAAMTLDQAGITPNPARDKSIKLPREEPEEINPPSAVHVETVYRLVPSKHRLPLLWLDWSGARVSSIDLTRVGDYDEPRRRVRLRASTTKTRKALWVELHPALADALEQRLGPREDRDPDARLFAGSGADALRTSIAKACKAARRLLIQPGELRKSLHVGGFGVDGRVGSGRFWYRIWHRTEAEALVAAGASHREASMPLREATPSRLASARSPFCASSSCSPSARGST